MQRNEDVLTGARDALARLARLDARGRPVGADGFDWAADAMDELARIAQEVARLASELAGDPEGELAGRADDLTTAVVRRRNAVLGAAPRPAARR